MKQVELTQNIYCLVDDEDYTLISQYKWQAAKMGRRWIAITSLWNPRIKKQKILYMHRMIINPPFNMEVDHIEHYDDHIDNCKSNLRVCTHVENGHNRRSAIGSSSQYLGVSWNKKSCKWLAQIRLDTEVTHLGYFDNQIDAAKIYDKTAKKYFGEFAHLNFS